MYEKSIKFLIIIGIVFFVASPILFLWQNHDVSFSYPIDALKFESYGGFISGAVGTLWSLAGILLFYTALKEQRKDFITNKASLDAQLEAFKLQIQEFELQRNELVQTRNVFEEQSKTLKIQQFESTFFNTFNLLNNITQNISFTYNPPTSGFGFSMNKPEPGFRIYTGKNSFEYFYKELKQDYLYSTKAFKDNYFAKNPNLNYTDITMSLEDQLLVINHVYEKLFIRYQADLGHYFRTLYNLVKFVDMKQPEDVNYYSRLIRSQLSTFEHLLLFYNCLSTYGKVKFKPFLIKYSMLDNLPLGELLDPQHKSLYDEQAYN